MTSYCWVTYKPFFKTLNKFNYLQNIQSMKQIKYTGVNIAAALIILLFFLPWLSAMGYSRTGLKILSLAVSPDAGETGFTGFFRFFSLLVILVPLSAALILYQNITGNLKFSKYYRLSLLLPVIYLLVFCIILYFGFKEQQRLQSFSLRHGYYNDTESHALGLFDILTFWFYLLFIASAYLSLVRFGKIKDKEYYKPSTMEQQKES